MQFPCCRFDLKALPVDFVECLMRFLPTEAESKLLRQYERERRPLDQLAEEDRFMLLFSKIERLTQRMSIITFVGNFSDNVNMLTPVSNYDGQQMESWEILWVFRFSVTIFGDFFCIVAKMCFLDQHPCSWNNICIQYSHFGVKLRRRLINLSLPSDFRVVRLGVKYVCLTILFLDQQKMFI